MKLIKPSLSSIAFKSGRIFGLSALFLLFSLVTLQASNASNYSFSITQQSEIKGTVTDSQGMPLPTVSVKVEGTTIGTETDFDGNFSINAKVGDVLIFSFVGMETFSKTIENTSALSITMQDDLTSLDEVVVVGYSSILTKKVTSSIATVNVAELSAIPATSLGNVIAGKLTGVSISQSGGRPGKTSDIIIRGATNAGFRGNSSPLYVIDGITASKSLFDALDVSEVKSVIVLKDAASTAPYGARAANGVILVTTNTGHGKAKISLTTSIGTTEPTRNPQFNNAYEHAILSNKRYTWENQDPSSTKWFSQSEIDYLKVNEYGSFVEEFAQTPMLNNTSLTISGSTDNVSYFLAGSAIKETAVFENMSFKKLNLRSNVSVDISDDLNVSLNMNTSQDEDEGFYWRWNGGDENYGDFYRTALRSGAWGPSTNNGEFVANFNGWNAGNLINGGAGTENRQNKLMNALIKINYKIPFVEGLSAGFSYNKRNIRSDRTLFRQTMTDYTFAVNPSNRFELTDEIIGVRNRNDSGADSDSWFESTAETDNYQLNASLNYSNTFDDHSVSGYVVYEQWEQDYHWFNATGRGVITPFIKSFNGTTDGEERASGSLSEDGRQSIIGGGSYSYKEKYLISATVRYDGSINFPKDDRYGLFPSVSLGWVMSDEDFLSNANFVDFLKVRASYGQTGNDNVGVGFPYIQKYSLGTGAVFGTDDNISSSTNVSGVPNPDITWETQTSYNFGVDTKFLGNKLSVAIDVFKNEKRDLYGNVQSFVPQSSGLTLVPDNYGGIDISGAEILTSYSNKIGNDFTYEAGFNFSYTKSKYHTIDQPETTRPHLILDGQETNRLRTYVSQGIIRTQAQLDALLATGYQAFGRDPKIGEVYFKDFRGNSTDDPEGNTPDGIIDGNDQEYLKHSTAPINYGFRLALNYKNFHLLAFAQGFAGHQRIRPQSGRFTLDGVGQTAWANWNDSWSPDNPNASYPVFGGDQGWNQRASTFFMEDADFLRLKNLNIGYDLPKKFTSKIGADRLSLFVNGTNLFMIYSSIKDYDPETSGRGLPVNRTYSAGLNITF